jgi:hypothetical protein
MRFMGGKPAFLALFAFFSITGCFSNSGERTHRMAQLDAEVEAARSSCPNSDIGRISLSVGKSELVLGVSTSVQATVFHKNGAVMGGCQVSFSVSSTAILSVSSTGALTAQVQAVGAGSASVQASRAGVKATALISVSPPSATTTVPPITTTTTTIPASAIRMGETEVLGTNDGGNGNMLLSQQATLLQTATLQSLSFYVTTASGSLRLGVYDASGPGGGPGTKLAETASFIPVSGWNTANVLTPVTLSGGTYWLAYLPSSSSLGFRVGTGGTAKHFSYAFGPMPQTFSTTPTTEFVHWSLYATLNTSGVVPPTTTTTIVSPTTTTTVPSGGAGAYPDSSNTGVPAGTALTIVNGGMNITTAGTLVENKDIRGCITVNAPNVIIRRSKVSCFDGGVIFNNSTNLLVEDVTLDCQGVFSGYGAIGRSNYTARRINAYNCVDILWAENNVLIEDSYLHDPIPYDPVRDPHTDAVQIPGGASNITIRHNRIYGGYIDQSNFGNSAITMGSVGDPTSNIIVDNNILAGGGWTMYCNPGGRGLNNAYTNNRFSRIFVSTVGGFGTWAECGDENISGNVYHETGQLLPGQ